MWRFPTTGMHSKIIGMLNVYNSYFDITYLETSMENIFVLRKEDISGAALEKMIRVLGTCR